MTHAHRSANPISTHDTTRIDDTRIKAVRPLITPALLQEWLPAPDAALARVESCSAAISLGLHGRDDRLIVEAVPHPRPRPGHGLRAPAQATGGCAAGRSARRHARVL